MPPKALYVERLEMASACNVCKQTKQKCQALQACGTGVGRETRCAYIPKDPRDVDNPPIFSQPPKRQQTEPSDESPSYNKSPTSKRGKKQKEEKAQTPESIDLFQQARTLEQGEEADIYGQTRMLQDQAGKLLYFGDSSACSYLQLIRMIVESSAGPSQFTMDPGRHKTNDATLNKPHLIGNSSMLPEKKVAEALMQSFYINMQGFVDVIDRREFQCKLNQCYTNPFAAESPDLCLIYLVLSIGLATAAPTLDGPEYDTIARIRSQPIDRAEIFFQNAKNLGDASSGFEDGDIWSIQALCLMSVYTLVVSRRNAAYAFLGMAIRLAYSLGLHKTFETGMIFKNDELIQRRNLWRSLFILDHFLALSLGRPSSMSDQDCSSGSLAPPPTILSYSKRLRQEQINSLYGLDAGVKASRTIGLIIKQIYSKGKVSTREAQEIVDHCQDWASNLDATLDANRLHDPDAMKTYGMAILQVQLLGHHSIILLSRIFFLHLLMKMQNPQQVLLRDNSAIVKFSEACLNSSRQTIKLCHIVFESRRLPRRNPFVIYFLYSAALIVMTNEFAGLHSNVDYPDSTSDAMEIMSYCATMDNQASHFFSILSSFQLVIENQARSRASGGLAINHQIEQPENMSTTSSNEAHACSPSSDISSGKAEANLPNPREPTPCMLDTTQSRSRRARNPWAKPSFTTPEVSDLQIERDAFQNQEYSSESVLNFSGPQAQSQGTPESGQNAYGFQFSNPSRYTPNTQRHTPMDRHRLVQAGMGHGGYLASGSPGMPRDQTCGTVNSVNGY